MRILPLEQFRKLRRAYRKRFGLMAQLMTRQGQVTTCHRTDCLCHLPVFRNSRRDALEEGVRWGEPYIFYLAPEIVSWVVPVVDGDQVLGGILGGEVLVESDYVNRSNAVNYLAEYGYRRDRARHFVDDLPTWSQERISEATGFLYDRLYKRSRLKPRLLRINRENVRQQKEITAGIRERRARQDESYPFEKERMLLSRMRVGDKGGARRILNDMLAALFLSTPKLVLLKVRMIELLSYLARIAVEDNPVLHSLLDQYPVWAEQILATKDFEDLCSVSRIALDEFMNHIFLQGHNRSSEDVRKVLHYLSQHYREPIRLDNVAAAAGLSKYHMIRLVKAHTGKTILQHVKRLRVEHACQLLARTDRDYVDIAYEMGFADQSYFIKQFKELTGLTPARFRKERTRTRWTPA